MIPLKTQLSAARWEPIVNFAHVDMRLHGESVLVITKNGLRVIRGLGDLYSKRSKIIEPIRWERSS